MPLSTFSKKQKNISQIVYLVAILMLMLAPFQYQKPKFTPEPNSVEACSGYCELTLTKTDNVDPVNPGNNIVYHLRLENTGTAECTGGGVKLRDYFDSRTTPISASVSTSDKTSDYWEWNFGTIYPNDVKEVDFTVTVDSDVPCQTELLNKAKYWSDQTSWGSYVEETTQTTSCQNPVCGDGNIDAGEQCDDGNTNNNDGCSNSCMRQLVDVPINSCTGNGTILLYQGDQNQDLDVNFTATGNEVLIFVKDTQPPSVEINGNGFTPNLVEQVTSPFPVSVYSISTNLGDDVYVYADAPAQTIQGYLMQNHQNPVYDISSLNVIVDDQQSNDMYLTPGTYSYLFFDKYSKSNNGGDDSRNLTVDINGPNGNFLHDSYTKPYPTPTEGVVLKDYTISESGNYSLSVDTEDSIYWFLNDCPAVPVCGDGNIDSGETCDDGAQNGQVCNPGYDDTCSYCSDTCELIELTGPYCGDNELTAPPEECDGVLGVGPHQECTDQCTLNNLNYCGDGIKQTPNDDGFNEECDGNDGVGANQECSSNCELIDLPYCGNGILDSGEECDDGNNNDGDGCSATCTEELGAISGCKYKDLDNSGTIDAGEPTIGQWTIYLTDSQNNQTSIQTDINSGCYTFTDLAYDTYTVTEDQVPGWTQTYPANPNNYTITVNSNTEVTNRDFANYQNPTGPVCGNGILETDEQCDDGNTQDGDGCSATCTIENNEPYCGDGIVNQTSEECDGTAGDYPSNYACNDSCQTYCVTNCGGGGGGPVNPYITIEKDADVSYTNPDTIVTYTISVTNTGSKEGLDLVVTDDLPNGLSYTGMTTYGTTTATTTGTWELGTINIGETKTFNYDVYFGPDLAKGDYINTAIATISNGNSDTDDATVEVRIPTVYSHEYAPILDINKEVNMEFTNPGGEIVYTVTITNTNNGDLTAQNVTLFDRLPSEFEFLADQTQVKSWNLGDLKPLESVSVSYEVKVKPDTKQGIYDNLAVAKADNAPEVAAKAPIEVRDVTVLGLELPDTNGGNSALISIILGVLLMGTGYLFHEIKKREALS